MDFNKARTFVEVVDCGGVSAAGSRLLRSQQAISAQILQLEQDLNTSLFDRNGPNLQLTKDGEKLYAVFRQQLFAMENAVLSLKSSKEQVSGVIRVGVWMEQAVSYLPEMIRLFKQDYPLVEFDLHVTDDIEIEGLLLANKIDFGLQVYCQDKKLLKQTKVYRQPLLPVVSRTFLKHSVKPKSIKDCLSTALVDYPDAYSAFNGWIKKNQKDLYPEARKKVRNITAGNNVVLKQLVLQGLGMGFLHHEAIQAELDIGELVPLFSGAKYSQIYVDIDLVYKRKHSLGFIHLKFMALLEKNKSSWCK